MNEKELQVEEKTIAEQQCEAEIAAETEAGPTCPLEPDKPWGESICGLMEQRVIEQVVQHLKAEQPLQEVAAPAEDEVPVGEDYQHPEETTDEPAIATEPEPKED